MIDAHCHLADPNWRERLEEILARSEAAGVRAWLQGGVGPEDWAFQRELAARKPGRVLPVFGLHPWWIMEKGPEEVREGLKQLEAELDRGGAVAVGETGLDHFRRNGQSKESLRLELQHEAFRAQVRMARERALPLVLHIVQAHGEALKVLEGSGPLLQGGLVHAFSGSMEIAGRYLKLGLLISVGTGLLGPKGFETLKRSVIRMPADQLVIESDAPDAKDPSWEPSRLREVAEALGRFRKESAEEVIERSNANLKRVFGV